MKWQHSDWAIRSRELDFAIAYKSLSICLWKAEAQLVMRTTLFGQLSTNHSSTYDKWQMSAVEPLLTPPAPRMNNLFQYIVGHHTGERGLPLCLRAPL